MPFLARSLGHLVSSFLFFSLLFKFSRARTLAPSHPCLHLSILLFLDHLLATVSVSRCARKHPLSAKRGSDRRLSFFRSLLRLVLSFPPFVRSHSYSCAGNSLPLGRRRTLLHFLRAFSPPHREPRHCHHPPLSLPAPIFLSSSFITLSRTRSTLFLFC